MALIRDMQLNDLKEVLEIEKNSFPKPMAMNYFITQLAKDTSVCLVAEEAGHIIGYIVVTQYVEVWHILDIAVHDDYRRRYIATDLLDELFKRCGRKKHRGYTLEVRKSNRGAIKMYESFHFICSGVRKGYYSDNGEDALIMWKDSEDMLA